MRPHNDGVTYDRRQYGSSSDHAAHHRSGGPSRDGGRDEMERERDSNDHGHGNSDVGRHDPSRQSFSSHHDHYRPHMHPASVHGHHPGSVSAGGALTAPGSSDHSPHHPASHPYDHNTPPHPQGYRPYLSLSSPAERERMANGPGPMSNAGRRDSDVSMATTSTKRAHDTPGSDLRTPASDFRTPGSDLRTPASDRNHRSQQPTPTSGEHPRQPWDSYRMDQGQDHSPAPATGSQNRQNQGTTKTSASSTAGDNDGDMAEPPAKKRRRAKAAPAQDIPEGAEVEYEDPGGDQSRGPVFVHPPKGAVQACIRCHRIKRKCDGAWPRCASCTRVDTPCVFELSAATSNYVHKLKKTNGNLEAELRESQAMVHALQLQLAGDDKGKTVGHRHGGLSQFGRLVDLAGSIRDHAPLNFAVPGASAEISTASDSPPEGRVDRGHRNPSHEGVRLYLPDIMSRDEAIKSAQTYFDFSGLAYPLLERTDIIPEMLDVYDMEKERDQSRDQPHGRVLSEAEERAERRKFLVYMMLTIGRSCAVRLGDKDDRSVEQALYTASLRYRNKAVCREDILCVQALLMMAMCSTEVPDTGSLWQTLGLAGRVAISIGLHRRSEAPPEIAEQRRRVFYSFYNLDRLVAATFSKPLTIAEHDIDIELPTDRPSDQPYRGWPIMHICRYIIRYRRLLGCTLTALYSVNGEQNSLPEPERRAIVRRLHEELEAWVADGPNPKGVFTFARTINHEKFLAINYHQMLCMLYRPSPLYPDTTPATLRALHDASAKCIDLYCDLWDANKVGFNVVQIVGLFVACISLLCCLCECDTRMHSAEVAGPATTAATLAELGLPYTGVDDPAWAAEIRARVAQCRNLFKIFGVGTPLSAKYRDLFTRFSELLLARYGPLTRDRDSEDDIMADAKAPISVIDPPANPAPAAGDALAGDMAGAWDAMNQLWHDLGDLFGDQNENQAMGMGLVPINPNVPVVPVGANVNGVAGTATGLGPLGVGAGIPGMSMGMPVGNMISVNPALGNLGIGGGMGVGMGGGAYPLGYASGSAPYGQYAAYAASYPGPYGEYGELDDSWAEHWRPEGEGWWGHGHV